MAVGGGEACPLQLCRPVAAPPHSQGYYVNLLKAISLKLNETTVQFFFQQGSGGGGGGGRSPRAPTFPLYTESIKFVNHRSVGVDS